jgi:hypothetical protein
MGAYKKRVPTKIVRDITVADYVYDRKPAPAPVAAPAPAPAPVVVPAPALVVAPMTDKKEGYGNECTIGRECIGKDDPISFEAISTNDASCFRGRCYEEDTISRTLALNKRDPMTNLPVSQTEIDNIKQSS